MAAYIAILKMNPNGILVAFGIALIAVGWIYRTPFPVQPMKAIGASALGRVRNCKICCWKDGEDIVVRWRDNKFILVKLTLKERLKELFK